MQLSDDVTNWRLACAVLAYYCIAILPIAYIFYTQGRPALLAWVYLSIYAGLQIAGNAVVAVAGPHGGYSYVGPVLTSVGLSPLLIGAAGVLHQWFNTTKLSRNSGPGLAKRVTLVTLAFHVGASMAIALIAAGGSMSAQTDPPSYASTLLRAGAVVLFVMFLVLCVVTAPLASHHMRDSGKCLIWSVIITLPVLAVRYAYEIFSSFSSNPDSNPIHNRLVFRIVFEVVPQALVLLVLIIGAILHVEDNIRHDVLIDRTATIPLRGEEEREGTSSGQRWLREPRYRRSCGMLGFLNF